jgi:hypothetical protein
VRGRNVKAPTEGQLEGEGREDTGSIRKREFKWKRRRQKGGRIRQTENFLSSYCRVRAPPRIRMFGSKLLKETVSRDFYSGFFHQTSSPSPVRHAWKGFQIFSNIRGVIRVCNRLPGS